MGSRVLGILKVPREPSVTGMMIISYIGSVVISRPSISTTVVSLLLVLLHLFSFDTIFDAIKIGRLGRRIVLLLLVNILPYIIILVLLPNITRLLVSLLLLLLLLQYTILVVGLGSKHVVTMVMGSAIPVSSALIPALIEGEVTTSLVLFWGILTLYSIVTAIYVETRLAFRYIDRRIPLILWFPSLLFTFIEPLLLVALIEPFTKLIYNIFSKVRLSDAREIRRMGFIELGRLILFVVVVVFILLT